MEKTLGNLNELLFNLKCNYNNISTPLSRSNKSLDPMKKGTNPGWKNWNRKKGNKSSQNIYCNRKLLDTQGRYLPSFYTQKTS